MLDALPRARRVPRESPRPIHCEALGPTGAARRPRNFTVIIMQERIVILGGGIAALTAAFELTSEPQWKRRRSITIYQMGHRLGGKGASGRNREKHNRIEEHGLHLFYGFYENAFHLMRRCYTELGRPADAPLATVEEAFKPHSLVVFEDRIRGRWQHQPLLFPRNEGVPGTRAPLPTPAELVPRMMRYLVELYDEQIALREGTRDHADLGLSEEAWDALPRGAERDLLVIRLLRKTAAALAEEMGSLLARRDEGRARALKDTILDRLIACSSRVRALAAPLLEDSPDLRMAWTAADVTLTMIRGMIAEGLVDRANVDWLALDHEDFRAWLRRHGASEDAANAASVCGVYAGAYSAGREIGAGTALHWTLRMLFTYRGSIFYKMQAGMGDVVFAPLYQVLRARGVRFRFFHRLDRLRLSAGRTRVEAIEMGQQIVPRSGEYHPLVDVEGLPSWPSEPLYDQLEGGDELRSSGESLEDFGTRWADRGGPITLRAGRDFDRVILGIGLGAVPAVCGELMEDEGNPRFAAMVRSIQTTQTASVQLWMKPDLRETGFPLPPPVMIPYADPLDTWCDMSHLLRRESFPAGARPGSCAYLTAAMPDDGPTPRTREEARGYGERQHRRIAGLAAGFLRDSASHLWPAISKGTALDLETLWGEDGSSGEERLAWQHVSAMHHPSDRYVLSVRGSTRDRLGAEDSGYDNLTLCGDWVMNPMNLGCVEGATMSGMQAARALGVELTIHDDWLSAREGRKPKAPRAYVERGFNESTAPPYQASDVAMYTAVLPADPARLRDLVDRHLNLGDEKVYLPLGPFTLFYAQDTRALSSADVPGHVPERDFGFMIPVASCTRDRGRLRVDGIAVYMPFLWVDLGAAVYGGREVLGFPKGLAHLDFPVDPDHDGTLRVRTLIPPLGRAGHRGEPWREVTLVEAQMPRQRSDEQEENAPQTSLLETLAAGVRGEWLRRSGLDRTGQIEVLRAIGRTLRSGVVNMVFLKQYRDAQEPGRACYQAIVEATCARRGKPRETALLPRGSRVSVHRDSGLADALGLRGEVTERSGTSMITASAAAAFYMDFDFTLGAGEVVWSSEATRERREEAMSDVVEMMRPLRISA
ncbi:cytoplasmic membrane protein [Minicystis rosea]|nr:cytoplasmic membrane protein [Minicystis rosea]